jgi:hypothetical protein
VDRITAWSSKWSKIKKFDDIDFDKLVTDVALRDHLRFHIPENKTLLNMKGKAKKPEGAGPGASKKPARRGPRTLRPLSWRGLQRRKGQPL